MENGRIRPLSAKGMDSVADDSTAVAGAGYEESTAYGNEYLERMGSGEIPAGPPVFVFFAVAGSRFDDQSQVPAVNAAADLAVRYGLRVRITGAADSATGTPEKNDGLAAMRAEYVAELMKGRGVKEEDIGIRSEGGTDSYGPAPANRNCRIELFVR